MASNEYGRLPASNTLNIKPFRAHVDETKLKHMKDLLSLSPIGISTFENTSAGRHYGMNRDWLSKAKDHWLHKFDWRTHEEYINSFPNFTASLADQNGSALDVHFAALFSKKRDAVPVALFHGWPGSFLEFLELLDIVRKKWRPEEMPFHLIVPSLPGFAYSSGPPVESDFGLENVCFVMDKLLVGLGFGNGYLVQGGDIGSAVCRIMALKYEACKGMHLNMISMPRPENAEQLEIDALEKKALNNGDQFANTGYAYAAEHGTRTATIGHALSSSPLAVLSWVGEKFLEWTDEDPPLDKILEGVTLYWLTDTMSRNMYNYRSFNAGDERPRRAQLAGGLFGRTGNKMPPFVSKPSGYSFFPCDIFPVPKTWAAQTCNLVAYGQHSSGGHFAAMEKPRELLADVEEWVTKAWKAQSHL